MELGCFSLSLAVKDINKSQAFYTAMGFKEIGGNIEQNWLILQNGECKIGLFQGMFEDNILTFNPADVRGIEAGLKEQGINMDTESQGDEGPAHIIFKDPDGNIIMLDQHG